MQPNKVNGKLFVLLFLLPLFLKETYGNWKTKTRNLDKQSKFQFSDYDITQTCSAQAYKLIWKSDKHMINVYRNNKLNFYASRKINKIFLLLSRVCSVRQPFSRYKHTSNLQMRWRKITSLNEVKTLRMIKTAIKRWPPINFF